MKPFNKKYLVYLVVLTSFFSCKDLTELNENPNGVQSDLVNPNLILPTVLTEAAKDYLDLGYQNIAGVVQHTQKDAWSGSHNGYDWSDQNWGGYYGVLRNNDLLYQRAGETNFEFHQGVALVMRAFEFGLITDLWGDAPYTNALKAEAGGAENLTPAFDSQETIYRGILADLEKANTMLSKPKGSYSELPKSGGLPADVYFNGDPKGWQKFANSLALRYFLRISDKLPDVAKAGMTKIISDPAKYPIITKNTEDVTMSFPGTSGATSWPANTVYDASGSNYRRIKMAATLVESLQAKNDPRLGIWANKIEVPLVVDATLPAGTDKIVNGKRMLSPDKVGKEIIDTDPEYVGLPTSFSALPSAYNLNPTPGQLSFNPHVSFLNDRYKAATGPLLKARLISAAEVHFILAEAAMKGWITADAKMHYQMGIENSLKTWTVGDKYATYIAQKDVAYDGTLKQIMEQKWIASWTAATEAWFDFRRTGLPALKAGPVAKREVLPVRFYYAQVELNTNTTNADAALGKLEVTKYSQADNKNSAWSKPWLIQGTGKPW